MKVKYDWGGVYLPSQETQGIQGGEATAALVWPETWATWRLSSDAS